MLKKAVNCINTDLLKMYQNSANLEQLDGLVLRQLPKHLHTFVKVSNFKNGLLTLCFSTPGSGNELRYLVPELITKLRTNEKLYNLVSIKLIRMAAPVSL